MLTAGKQHALMLLFGILVLLIGDLIAIPYKFLAGAEGSPAELPTFCAFAFMGTVCLALLRPGVRELEEINASKSSAYSIVDAFLQNLLPKFLLYCLTPILMHGVAILLHAIGMNIAADVIYKTRYELLWYVPAVLPGYAALQIFSWLEEEQASPEVIDEIEE